MQAQQGKESYLDNCGIEDDQLVGLASVSLHSTGDARGQAQMTSSQCWVLRTTLPMQAASVPLDEQLPESHRWASQLAPSSSLAFCCTCSERYRRWVRL